MNTGNTRGSVSLSRILTVVFVIGSIFGVMIVKQQTSDTKPVDTVGATVPEQRIARTEPQAPVDISAAADTPTATVESGGINLPARPKLVDLGAGKCVPCRAMKPILDSLREEFKGRFDVVFIDVWENREAGSQYGVRMIPTQIFYDETGKKRFRHEGFFSREDILKTWKDLGYPFE